jgi:hypothetical protein
MAHADWVESQIRERENWIFRRNKRIPNKRRLFVLA